MTFLPRREVCKHLRVCELLLLLLFMKGGGQQLEGRQHFGNNFVILSVLAFQKLLLS